MVYFHEIQVSDSTSITTFCSLHWCNYKLAYTRSQFLTLCPCVYCTQIIIFHHQKRVLALKKNAPPSSCGLYVPRESHKKWGSSLVRGSAVCGSWHCRRQQQLRTCDFAMGSEVGSRKQEVAHMRVSTVL